MDGEQLGALRRQMEEDYRLDMAAIERIQQWFLRASNPSVAGTEQLEALRLEVEENHKLDVAAVEWLQRRFPSAGKPAASVNSGSISRKAYSAPSEWSSVEASPEKWSDARVEAAAPAPAPAAAAEKVSDPLIGSLRTIFGSACN